MPKIARLTWSGSFKRAFRARVLTHSRMNRCFQSSLVRFGKLSEWLISSMS